MQENLILGLFLFFLIVAGVIGIIRFLYAFLNTSPETGDSEINVTIHLKGNAEVEQVLRAAKEMRNMFFPTANVLILCEENFEGKAIAKKASLLYKFDFEEIP
ncbi:MAG: hypothetical protein N2Z65_02450 [Clostridiales bacterium]|nr:hypothetical protein [Clostridiales bacterium]